MERRTKLAVAAFCALVGVVVLYFTVFRASAEDRIRVKLDALAKAVSVKDGESIIPRTARVRSRLKEVVDDDVRVNVPELGVDLHGRRALEDHATKAGLAFQSADCVFAKLAIKLDPPETIATVDGTALVTAVRGGERRVDERVVHFLLRSDGGEWRVTTIDVTAPAAAH